LLAAKEKVHPNFLNVVKKLSGCQIFSTKIYQMEGKKIWVPDDFSIKIYQILVFKVSAAVFFDTNSLN
jgi:hypothetical protein